MLLRIALIIALAVAVAGLGLSFVLRQRVNDLSAQRDQFRTERDEAQQAERQAKTETAQAKKEAKEASDKLAETEQQLADVTKKATELEERGTRLASDLERTTTERNTAQQKLARWEATGIQPDQILDVKAEARKLKAERDAYAEEKTVMSREIARITEKLHIYEGVITEVTMPDVRGAVVAFDKQYRFVVLNLGSDQGLKETGKMVVSRNGNLVAKVQLVRVEPQRAVGNIMSDWANAEVQAGDEIMTSYEALARQ